MNMDEEIEGRNGNDSLVRREYILKITFAKGIYRNFNMKFFSRGGGGYSSIHYTF